MPGSCSPANQASSRCFRSAPPAHPEAGSGSYDTAALTEVLEQRKAFHRGERVVLVWEVRDGLSAHGSRAMRARVADQDWLGE
ncbi:hypothetical protein ACFYP6_13885 [Streptomyces goshikiensis]|uniref:hypothetical protein n=1 Tax=Streptomyces goshikiensis TaxID=1942 RepID=UPI0036BF0CD7